MARIEIPAMPRVASDACWEYVDTPLLAFTQLAVPDEANHNDQ